MRTKRGALEKRKAQSRKNLLLLTAGGETGKGNNYTSTTTKKKEATAKGKLFQPKKKYHIEGRCNSTFFFTRLL